MKGFNITPQPGSSGTLPPVAEFIASLQQVQHENPHHELFGSTLSGIFAGPSATSKRSPHHTSTNSVPGLVTGPRQGRGTRDGSRKKRWGTLIEAAKAGRVSRLIGKSRARLRTSIFDRCKRRICFRPRGARYLCSLLFKRTPRSFSAFLIEYEVLAEMNETWSRLSWRTYRKLTRGRARKFFLSLI